MNRVKSKKEKKVNENFLLFSAFFFLLHFVVAKIAIVIVFILKK